MHTLIAHATGSGHTHPEEIIVIIGLVIAAIVLRAMLCRNRR